MPEWLVSQKLGLRLEKNSARGLDATGSDGLRYQIKCRWERTDFPTPQSRELGVIRSLEKTQFDFLIAVIFDSHFQVRAAYQIPHEIIPRYAVYRRHVNGHILLADGPTCGIPPPKDITPPVAVSGHAFTPGKFTLFSLYRARFPAILWSKGAAPLKMCDRRIL